MWRSTLWKWLVQDNHKSIQHNFAFFMFPRLHPSLFQWLTDGQLSELGLEIMHYSKIDSRFTIVFSPLYQVVHVTMPSKVWAEMKHISLATKFHHTDYPRCNLPFLPQTSQPLQQLTQAPAGSPASEDLQDSTVIIYGMWIASYPVHVSVVWRPLVQVGFVC